MEKSDFDRALREIDAAKAAAEVLTWLTKNVEQYVDNHEYSYSLTLSVKDDSMPQLWRIKKLFHDVFGLPEDRLAGIELKCSPEAAATIRKAYETLCSGGRTSVEDAKQVHLYLQDAEGGSLSEADAKSDAEAALLPALYVLVDRVKAEMHENDKMLDDLCHRLVYFYELAGFREGKMLELSLDGSVEFGLFEYHSELTIIEAKKKVPVPGTKGEYAYAEDGHFALGSPGGFMIEFDLKTWPKAAPTSIF